MNQFKPALWLAGILMIAPFALGAGALPLNPVANPSFELQGPTGQLLDDTAADECIGIGHQVYYGNDSVPGHADDTVTYADEDGDDIPDDTDEDGVPDAETDPEAPGRATERPSEDPAEYALYTAGYGYCVWGDEDGYDLCYCNPVALTADPAIQWSSFDAEFGDFDGDFDREARLPGQAGGGPDLYQAFLNPHQAWSPAAEDFHFTVESGPAVGGVSFHLSSTPAHQQNDRIALYLDCSVYYTITDDLKGDGGVVSLDVTDGRFHSRGETCADLKAAWDDAEAGSEERMDVLSKTRLVQLNFDNWGSQGPTIIDDVGFTNAKTAPEALLFPGWDVNPDV